MDLAALFVIAFLLTAVAVLIYFFRKTHKDWPAQKDDQGFLYSFLTKAAVPIAGPTILAAIGFWIGYQVDKQRNVEADNQSKATILREMMTTRNGPDVAFFTAVGERLIIHLQRYEKELKQAKDETVDQDMVFDETAIYFFYGMFRVARLDFLATKGYVLYPRIWMEQAFDGLMTDFIVGFTGITDNDLRASPQEQAALYRYFGASKATYHTTSERSTEVVPDLLEFNSMLTDSPEFKTAESLRMTKDPYYQRTGIELRRGFSDFRKRLRSGNIRTDRIIIDYEALVGLDDYAFNTLFSTWYKQFDPNVPSNLSSLKLAPPKDFLPYPLATFETKDVSQSNEEWTEERHKAWHAILKNVPPELQECQSQDRTATWWP